MDAATRIVVMGDWVVDEYWTLVDHSSDISSHVGRHHFRRAEHHKTRVRDLCGAGHVARVLHGLRTSANATYELVGLGNWDEGDTELIKHLFHLDESCPVAMAPASTFRIDPSGCRVAPVAIQLMSLRPEQWTTRVFRFYQNQGRMTVQLHRIDEEQQPDEDHLPDEQTERARERETEVETVRVLERLQDLDAEASTVIVVSDLDKGAVTDGCIKALSTKFENARWYVRSKRMSPSWLNEVRGELGLLLLGPEVVENEDPTSTLEINQQITHQALELLKVGKSSGCSVVLLTKRRQFLAYFDGDEHEEGEEDVIWGEAVAPEDPRDRIGWSTAVFASLVHEIEAEVPGQRPSDRHLRRALKRAAEECRKWSQERDASSQPPAQQPKSPRLGDGLVWYRTGAWQRMQREWDAAREAEELGIIPGKGDEKPRLEVWRGSTDLPGYIALMKEKRVKIRKLCASLHEFKKNSGHNPHNLAILLRADPGAGKTTLVRRLAEAFKFQFLPCDLTQLRSRDDLVDFFDTVATEQAREGENVLVFIDEINAPLGIGAAYSTFLTPLEERTYMRRQQRFMLRSSVWVFAGTEPAAPTADGSRHDQEERQGPKVPKYEDFVSRLTLTVELDYRTLKKEAKNEPDRMKREARLEQVYLGAALVGHYHPGVKWVSREVLWRFYGLVPEYRPARKIRQRAASLRNVHNGVITRRNWATPWDEYEEDGMEERVPEQLNGRELVRLQF